MDKPLTFRDLMHYPQESTHNEVHVLGGWHNHLPEAGSEFFNDKITETRVMFEVLKDFCFDGERSWTLTRVVFDGIPVMFIKNAGRGGSDHTGRAIVNRKQFDKMLAYVIENYTDNDKEIVSDTVSLKDKCNDFTDFYDHTLTGVFEHY
jgi:hypothetical protein